eukprot:1653208-Amphidinium_carterae.1
MQRVGQIGHDHGQCTYMHHHFHLDGRLGRPISGTTDTVSAEVSSVPRLLGMNLQTLAVGSHSAAINARDELYVWGTYLAEQNGSTDAAPGSVDMLLEPTLQSCDFVAQKVACGRYVTGLVSADSKLYLWGPNDAFQCGVAEPNTAITIMVQPVIPDGAPVMDVALGESHGMAMTDDGVVLVWGLEMGEEITLQDLGSIPGMQRPPDRGALNQPIPRALALPQKAVSICAGAYHSAVVTDNGALYTWGHNDHGQLGLGTDTPMAVPSPRKVAVPSQAAVILVSLGGFHSAAIDGSGCAFTW